MIFIDCNCFGPRSHFLGSNLVKHSENPTLPPMPMVWGGQITRRGVTVSKVITFWPTSLSPRCAALKFSDVNLQEVALVILSALRRNAIASWQAEAVGALRVMWDQRPVLRCDERLVALGLSGLPHPSPASITIRSQLQWKYDTVKTIPRNWTIRADFEDAATLQVYENP